MQTPIITNATWADVFAVAGHAVFLTIPGDLLSCIAEGILSGYGLTEHDGQPWRDAMAHALTIVDGHLTARGYRPRSIDTPAALHAVWDSRPSRSTTDRARLLADIARSL